MLSACASLQSNSACSPAAATAQHTSPPQTCSIFTPAHAPNSEPLPPPATLPASPIAREAAVQSQNSSRPMKKLINTRGEGKLPTVRLLFPLLKPGTPNQRILACVRGHTAQPQTSSFIQFRMYGSMSNLLKPWSFRGNWRQARGKDWLGN